MNINKTVVLLSGGIDSTTLAYYLKSNGDKIFPVVINYGQRHKKEIECAKKIADNLQTSLKYISLESCKEIFEGSSLTSEIDVPEGYYTDANMSITVVPNRNMTLLSLATAYALTVEASYVAYAAHAGDHFIYPDCRPQFSKSINDTIAFSTEAKVHLVAPFINMTKADIVQIGLNLKVPYEDTWSCYNGQEVACGKCGTCVERLEAFEKNNAIDPLKYQ